MPVKIYNEVEIPVSAEKLFNYVTQPWLWHEWHPSSRSASASHSFMATADEFEEVIEVRPLDPLPLRLRRSTAYTVTESVPFHTWEAKGKMKDGWLRIRYDFEEQNGVTVFARVLEFEVTGFSRVLRPLLKTNMEKISVIALDNLKRKITGEDDES